MTPAEGALQALLEGRHDDPFSLLGVFDGPDGAFAPAWIPGAEQVEAHDLHGAALGTLGRIDGRGLFEGGIAGAPQPVRYKASGGGATWWVTDPYSFGPVLGPVDDLLMAEGTHMRLYDKMGAHLIEIMQHGNHRASFDMPAANDGQKVTSRAGVDCGERLVQQDDAGILHQQAGKQYAIENLSESPSSSPSSSHPSDERFPPPAR